MTKEERERNHPCTDVLAAFFEDKYAVVEAELSNIILRLTDDPDSEVFLISLFVCTLLIHVHSHSKNWTTFRHLFNGFCRARASW